MCNKNCVLALYLLTIICQTQKLVIGAPYDGEDHNAIIVIPFKSTDDHVTKIESYKIDGETAVKQLYARVSAEKIIRTLSNIREFDVLLEGLDGITLGDVYKAAFPNGILNSIRKQYSLPPNLKGNDVVIIQPDKVQGVKSSETDSDNEGVATDIAIANDIYDEVNEEENNEDLKEEPITDDYVYDQPIEDRLSGDLEYVTRQEDIIENADSIDSKNMNYVRQERIAEQQSNRKISKYGASFRNWITQFLAG